MPAPQAATRGEALEKIEIPNHIFGYFANAFAREEAVDLAHSFQEGGLAHPSERFGEVFAWCWEEDRETAMRLLAQLLLAAQEQCETDDELTLDKLLDDLRYGLHRTKYAREEEYFDIQSYARTEVPAWIDGGQD
jgi:hypothetical protein